MLPVRCTELQSNALAEQGTLNASSGKFCNGSSLFEGPYSQGRGPWWRSQVANLVHCTANGRGEQKGGQKEMACMHRKFGVEHEQQNKCRTVS